MRLVETAVLQIELEEEGQAPRDGRGVALAADAIDLLDALGLERVPVVRHAEIEQIATPTLMIQGADDRCDEPSSSEGQERFFTGGYRRLLLDGVGHFPHREAPAEVAAAIDRHLRAS